MLETTGWQIPERSGWTLFIGLLPMESGEQSPWLYLVRPGVAKALTLARFKSDEHAATTQSFINQMFEQINRAIMIAQLESIGIDENPSEGADDGSTDQPRRGGERGEHHTAEEMDLGRDGEEPAG